MPLNVKGKTYPMPGEDGQQGLTGSEVIAIEDHFGLDGMTLLSAAFGNGTAPAGYTKVKGLYAIAWVAMSRAGEVLSLDDVLNDFAIEDFDFEDEPENPQPAA